MTPEIEGFMWLTVVCFGCVTAALVMTVREIARLQSNLSEVCKCAISQAKHTNELAMMIRKLAVERVG